MWKFVVPSAVKDMPLKQFLRRAFPMASGTRLREATGRRDVRVNGARMVDGAVNAGDIIDIYLPDSMLVGDIECVFADADVIIAIKPQGLPVDVDALGIGEDTLLKRARRVYGDVQLSHRLDTGTGGLVVLSRSESSASILLKAFKERRVHKEYICVVKGIPHPREKILKAYLEMRDNRARVFDAPRQGALEIITGYRVISTDGETSKLTVELITGRTHQIRAQLSHIGHPILGDDAYGDRALNKQYGGLKYQRLWCERLSFDADFALDGLTAREFCASAPF